MRQTQNDVIGLAILQKLEGFRKRMEAGYVQAGSADWAVRMCEAIVADYTQFDSRALWTAKLAKVPG